MPDTCTVRSAFVNVAHIFGYLSFLKDNTDFCQFMEINSCWKGWVDIPCCLIIDFLS